MNLRRFHVPALGLLVSAGCQPATERPPEPQAPQTVPPPRQASPALRTQPVGTPATAIDPHSSDEKCPEPEIVTDTMAVVVVPNYSGLHHLLELELEPSDEGPTRPPAAPVSEPDAARIVCAAIASGSITKLPKPRGATVPRQNPPNVCDQSSAVSVGVGSSRWYFLAIPDGFVAARDPGAPTREMLTLSGNPQLRLLQEGDYVLAELSNTISQCTSDPSLGCLPGGPRMDQLFCGTSENERCVPTGMHDTDLHIVDIQRKQIAKLYFSNQAAPKYSVRSGVLEVHTNICSVAYPLGP